MTSGPGGASACPERRLLRRLSRSFLVSALCALTTLAGASGAEESGYRVVPGWPAGAAQAPGYGQYAVSAVTSDAKDNVYVFQRAPQPVLVFDAEGRFLRSWGAGLFTNPHGCRIDPEGSLWLTDNADHRVMKFTIDGKLLATFGVKNQPGEDATHFNRPADVAFGPEGDIYIADGYGNSRVVRLSHDGKFLGAWGRKGAGEGEFNLPHSVAVDTRGRVYVADRENKRVQVFTREGKFLAQWQGAQPYGLAMTRDQKLLVSDGKANRVSLFDLDGKLLTGWGSSGPEPGQMNLAHLLCVDGRGAVYVAEVDGKRVQKFTRE